MSTSRKTSATRRAAAPAPASKPVPAKRKPAAAAKPAQAAPAPVAKPAKVEKVEKIEKAPKPPKAPKLRPRLVRDGFTMPEADFSLIGTLKARALAAAQPAKKSELLRAGLQALSAMDTPALVAALARLEPVKTGRPRKGG